MPEKARALLYESYGSYGKSCLVEIRCPIAQILLRQLRVHIHDGLHVGARTAGIELHGFAEGIGSTCRDSEDVCNPGDLRL